MIPGDCWHFITSNKKIISKLTLQCFVIYSDEEDTYDVYREVVGLGRKWSNMCLALRLLPYDQNKIELAYPGNPDKCLEAVIVKWLQKCYNYQRHGCPTWRMLVEAVGDPAGGNDLALAETIAKKHPGMYSVVQPAFKSLQQLIAKATNLG